MDKFTPEKRSEIMSKIGGKNTKPELLLRRTLFRLGLRYRIHTKDLPGKPDVVFKSERLAVFVDGDWWHGRNYKKESPNYNEFWQNKIKRTIERDKEVNAKLHELGWKVYRVWQKDLVKEPGKYADEIFNMLGKKKGGRGGVSRG
jgi:DNA mismatch endonuclease (patch repair protein)